MSTSKAATAPRKRLTVAKKPAPAADAGTEMNQVMTKLQTLENEVTTLLERSLCDTLQATGEVAKDISGTVRGLLGNAFQATREVSLSLLQAGTRTVEASRATARDAATTVQDFGRLANEAARQVMAGAAEGLAEVRASHARTAHHSHH